MYAFPLNFEISDSGLDSDVKLKDAKKQILLRGSKMTDVVLEGKQFYRIFRTERGDQLAYQIQYKQVNEYPHYSINDASGTHLGTLVKEKRGTWKILSFGGLPVGHGRHKNGWRRSCLLTFIPDVLEAMLYLLFPVRYELELDGKKALKLREKDPTGISNDGYTVKQTGELTLMEEQLLVGCLFALFWPD
jgi:hypothetical protein